MAHRTSYVRSKKRDHVFNHWCRLRLQRCRDVSDQAYMADARICLQIRVASARANRLCEPQRISWADGDIVEARREQHRGFAAGDEENGLRLARVVGGAENGFRGGIEREEIVGPGETYEAAQIAPRA